jgi:hypothetical protein
MGEPVQTQPKIREELMEMVKLQACSEVVAEEGLLLIPLVVVVVVLWQWMPMVRLLLIVPYWPWEVTASVEVLEVQVDQSAYRQMIFPLPQILCSM